MNNSLSKGRITARKLRVAQIGVSRFGAQRRARMRETGLFDLVAVYDWNKEALASVAAEENTRAVDSYDELLSSPGLEAVIISTGAKFHAEQAMDAMERGLHIFVEKPLCSTPHELSLLLETQERAGVVAAVGHVDYASNAVAKATKQMVESGALGTIAAVQATTAHSGGLHVKHGDWRADPETNPGGMLFHCGIHVIAELMFLFGTIDRVACVMRDDVHHTQTTDVAQCLLTFNSGLTAVLNAYHVTPYHETFHIFGTEATLYRETFNGNTTLTRQLRHPTRHWESKTAVEIADEDDPCGNLRAFYRAVRERDDSNSSWYNGVAALQVVFAAVEAARMGCMVEVASYAETAAVLEKQRDKCLDRERSGYNNYNLIANS